MSLPLMSVAVPAYNHALYLEACLDSIRKQTYPELELVVVDDGSVDNTPEIAEDFAAKHGARFQRIQIIRQKNSGVSAASNRAIAACQGEWVHLLGSDDLIYPQKIATQWNALQSWQDPSIALLYADVDFIDETGRVISSTVGNRPNPGPDPCAYIWLLRANRIPNPSVAIRRDAFKAIGGFNENLRLEDLDAWLRLSAKYSLARVPDVLAAYRRHTTNASQRQLMMFEAEWITLGNFATAHGSLVPQSIWKAAFRRRLRSFLRWSRKHAPELLPLVLIDAISTIAITPSADDFYRYATRCQLLTKQVG